MKEFLKILDKNFVNFIVIFVSTILGAYVFQKYNFTFIDIIFLYFSIDIYHTFMDKIILSFKKGDKKC